MCQFYGYRFQQVYLTVECCPVRNLRDKILQTPFETFDQSQYLLPTLHKFFVCVSVAFFIFLEIIKHNLSKRFFSFNIKMNTQKFTNFDVFFKVHADMTVVTIQYNKIVSNEVRKLSAYYSHFMEKMNKLLAGPIIFLNILS